MTKREREALKGRIRHRFKVIVRAQRIRRRFKYGRSLTSLYRSYGRHVVDRAIRGWL